MLEFIRENPLLVLLIYLLIMNVIGFVLMGIDKKKAEKNKWRIPEKTLFAAAMLGGSIGSILGMKVFRHKTKHNQFVYGMPAILAFQVMMAVLCIVQMIKVS